jgi:hypothetical protein
MQQNIKIVVTDCTTPKIVDEHGNVYEIELVKTLTPTKEDCIRIAEEQVKNYFKKNMIKINFQNI